MSFSNIANTLGLSDLDWQVAQNPMPLVKAKFHFDRIGALRTYDKASTQLFGQTIIRTKDRGVEPGFIARKVWTEKDKQKLLDPTHKFHIEAVRHFKLENIEDLLHDENLYNQVIAHLTGVFLKFKKEHWWKMHYASPIFGNAMIDYAQSKNVIHRLSTAETPREKNIAALMEVLANDIFTILDFGGQKLSLRLAQYDNGDPMFLLDSTEVFGPNGELFQTLSQSNALLQGPKKQGRIKGNMLPDPANPNRLVPIDEKKLGSSLLKSLLMGDRDKISSFGQNVGYVVVDGKAVLMNIDPGKSFEKPCWWRVDRMIGYVFRDRVLNRRKVKSDIRTDALFDPAISPKDLFTGGYKNFSIFNDTTLADRIEGMKDIQKKWPEIVALMNHYYEFFKKYESVLDPNRPQGEQPMHEVIREQYTRLEARVKMFVDILGDRATLSRDELNLLDNLEKLTSPTTKKAAVEGSEKEIELKYLQIVDPQKNRVEWSLEDGQFSFEAKTKSQFDATIATLAQFIGSDNFSVIENTLKGRVTFHNEKALSLFTQDNIVAFKKENPPIAQKVKASIPMRIAHTVFQFFQFLRALLVKRSPIQA